MKAKKGAARSRKFASGGDVAAGLVGLGTLGYLLSKKKDKEKEDSGPSMLSSEKSDVAEKVMKGPSADERERRANMGEPEESDIQKAVGKPPASTTPAKPSEPIKSTAKPAAKPAARKTASQSFPVSKPSAPAKEKPSGVRQLSEDSDTAKALREQRKQRLGANYAAQSRALTSAPEGPGKEALKKSVEKARRDYESSPMKKGGVVKSSASKRADGIAQRGKTKGRMV